MQHDGEGLPDVLPAEGGEGPRDRIMSSVLELVGERGAQGITVREIAARAGVNVGAVNYYFTSKDQLVSEALARFVRRNLALLDMLEDPTTPPLERLVSFMDAYAENLVDHPGIVRGLVHELQSEGPLPAPLGAAIRRGSSAVQAVLAEIDPDAEDLDVRVLHLFAGLQYPILLIDRLAGVFGIDMRDPEERRRYVRALAREVARA